LECSPDRNNQWIQHPGGAGIVNSATASIGISISLSGTVTAATFNINAYSGLNVPFIQSTKYDRVRQNIDTDSQIDTVASATTRYPYELVIGGALLNTFAQTSADNGFTLYDGVVENGISVSYFEKTLTTKSSAQTTVQGSGSATYGINNPDYSCRTSNNTHTKHKSTRNHPISHNIW